MTREEIKTLQRTLNTLGAGLKVDGYRGPLTMAAEKKYLNPKVVAPPSPLNPKDYFGASWVGANIDLLGLSETNPKLVARYEPEWRLEGLPGYKGLSGRPRAWCSINVNADFRKVGVKGTNSAAAASWSRWGVKCPFWFGAVLDIRHKGGGRHVCRFLYWIDQANGIAATLDGNRGNKFCVARTDISGKGDSLVAGPRGPVGWTGQFVSKADVLKAYPHLKVGGSVGSSTR